MAYNNLPGFTDDTTSKAAAKHIHSNAAVIRARVLTVFTNKPTSLFTPEDIADVLQEDKHTIRSRITELTRDLYLEKTTQFSVSRETGNRVHYWRHNPTHTIQREAA